MSNLIDPLPPVAATSCNECPWRREQPAGWLGPLNAEEWLMVAHSDADIACHLTIENEQGVYGRQCAGAAQFRTNVFKSPRDRRVATADHRDDALIFGTSAEFLEHHSKVGPR